MLTACQLDQNYAPVQDVAYNRQAAKVRHVPKIIMTSTAEVDYPRPRKIKSPFVVNPAITWIWPAHGKVISAYSPSTKGINIAGNKGDPIVAAAAGKVVYSGHGLRRYGNLIIIKHNNMYMSAYAYAQKVFVREGQQIKKGQKIAEMGSKGANKVMLHFEIRRYGQSIDPTLLYLG